MFQNYLQNVPKVSNNVSKVQNVPKVLIKYFKFKRGIFFQYLILAQYVSYFFLIIFHSYLFLV